LVTSEFLQLSNYCSVDEGGVEGNKGLLQRFFVISLFIIFVCFEEFWELERTIESHLMSTVPVVDSK